MDCGSAYEKLELINLSEHNVELWKKNRVPLSATIEITPKCNFSRIRAHRVSDGRMVLRVWSCEHIDRIIVRGPQIADDDAALGA